jgi:hypothetical protein
MTTARTAAAPAVTASISPTAAPTASTTVAPTTTTTLPPTTAAPPTTVAPPTSLDTSNIPSCADQPNAKVCTGVTVPLPADADVILARYRAFAAKWLEVASNPDAPDWDGLLAYVRSDVRGAARAEIEDHFKRGEVLNVSLGVSLMPVIDRSQYPEGQVRMIDCRTDGSYWADRTSGTPAAGEVAEVRRRPVYVIMSRVGALWMMSQFEFATKRC